MISAHMARALLADSAPMKERKQIVDGWLGICERGVKRASEEGFEEVTVEWTSDGQREIEKRAMFDLRDRLVELGFYVEDKSRVIDVRSQYRIKWVLYLNWAEPKIQFGVGIKAAGLGGGL